VSVVLPTKELQQELHSDEQFESLPVAVTSPSTSSSSLLAVSAAQQSSTNIHLQAVNHRQSRTSFVKMNYFLPCDARNQRIEVCRGRERSDKLAYWLFLDKRGNSECGY